MSDLTKLSDAELKNEARRLSFDIAKYHNYQLTKKVQLNSAYGAMGNQFFRFYDIRLAEAVTLSGQLVIQWLANDINAYLNNLLKTDSVDYIVASDTDSLYIRLDGLVKAAYNGKLPEDKSKIVDLVDKVAEDKLQKVIDKSCDNLKNYLNAFSQKMVMKRESIADKAIWTAKKRYMMNVFDSEGVRYETPKLKVQGIEAVKSSTPEICRNKIKDAIKIVMTKTQPELHRYISEFKKEFKTMPPEQIAFPRGLNTFDEGGDRLSIHARGAQIYNELVKKHKLGKKYACIQEGDKVKYIYLKKPNPIHSHVITMSEDGLPKEFDLHKYVDYEVQFEKTFLDPLKIILDAIKWTTKKVSTLEDIFD